MSEDPNWSPSFFERICASSEPEPERSEEELHQLYTGFLERLRHQVDRFDNSYNAVIQFYEFMRDETRDIDIRVGFGDIYCSSIPHVIYEGFCIAAKHFKTFLIYRSYGLADDLYHYCHVVELCRRMTTTSYFENIHFILCRDRIIEEVLVKLNDRMRERLISINPHIIPILDSIQSKIRNDGYTGEAYPRRFYSIKVDEVTTFVQPTL